MQNGAYQQMMMRNQANGMHMNNSELRQKAIQNRQNAYLSDPPRIIPYPNLFYSTPQQAQMLAQQNKQNQMQRDPSDGNNQQRAQSPASAENAPSPSKRPRLDANTPFNPNQMQNGRGQQAPGMPQQVGAHTNGMEPEPNNLTAQQFQVPGGNAQATRAYQAGLAQQQAGQMPLNKMPNQGGPQSQGSPMMPQGADGSNVANFYNPGTDIGGMGRGGPNGGQGGNAAGNHALQDYQMQLMLLEQQNKKRLMMARQEQDNMAMPRADGAPGPAMGPNGQPFQGTSPQGARNSPNPSDQMKRTPHMGPSNIPSPLPDGQTRSPSGMNFNNMGQGNPMDPNMAQKGFYPNMNGMDQNMVAAGMQNGMRPPSSHPGAGFNPMAQQMQMQQRQQQAAAQQAQQAGQNWNGPGGPMGAQPNQPPQQSMGTPRQGAMPPPSAPATGAAVNGRTQPPSPQQGTAAPPTPQQGNKANPKKKAESKDTKAKVYSIAFKWIFCRNVDIDDSGQRREPPKISTLVPLRPPMLLPTVQRQRRRLRLLLMPTKPLLRKMVPLKLWQTASHQLLLRLPTLVPLNNRTHYLALAGWIILYVTLVQSMETNLLTIPSTNTTWDLLTHNLVIWMSSRISTLIHSYTKTAM